MHGGHSLSEHAVENKLHSPLRASES